jgi:hypothetical protein
MTFGTFFGIQSSRGRNHVGITGSNGKTGIAISTSTTDRFCLTSPSPYNRSEKSAPRKVALDRKLATDNPVLRIWDFHVTGENAMQSRTWWVA